MAWKNVKAFCKDNSNTIFTVFACIFTVGTAVATVVETAKACKDISDAEYDKWEELGEPEEPNVDISLTTGETIKLVWPRYIIPTLLLGGAITCEICALKAGQKKIDALTGAYVMAAQTISALRESVRENLPARDVRRIESDVIHKAIEKDEANPEVKSKMNALKNTGETTTVYRDAYSLPGFGVYYKGTMDQFRKAVHLFNCMLEDYEKATLNDWYMCLYRVGIDVGQTDLGDYYYFYKEDYKTMDLYFKYDSKDVDLGDDVAVAAIGLRGRDHSSDELAMYSTPRKAYR